MKFEDFEVLNAATSTPCTDTTTDNDPVVRAECSRELARVAAAELRAHCRAVEAIAPRRASPPYVARHHRTRINRPTVLRVLGTRTRGKAGHHVKRTAVAVTKDGGEPPSSSSDDDPASSPSAPTLGALPHSTPKTIRSYGLSSFSRGAA